MGLTRATWWAAVAILGLPFVLGLPRTLRSRPRWIRHATPTRIALAVLELAAVLGWVFLLRARVGLPVGGRGSEVTTAAGAMLAIGGAVLSAWGRVALGRWFSPTLGVQHGHELVTGGPYALVRHPIYTGLILFTTGSALVWNDAGLLLLAGVLAGLLAAHIPVEERMFAEHFGTRWEHYRASTPALLPWPRPRRRGAPPL